MPFNPKLDGIIGYFDPTVLASYRAEPDKYKVDTDYFEGEVSVTSVYYESLPEGQRDSAYIGIKFGFRTLADGALALAAYLPDLVEKSEGHVNRWRGFFLHDPAWANFDEDDRFSKWVSRYFEGSWHVENGPASYIFEEIALINGLSREAVGSLLFALPHELHISYPAAQNTHRYEDAHADVYRLLQDGLDKSCIERVAKYLGRPLNASNLRALTALRTVFPTFPDDAFGAPLEKVSEQRARSTHKQRPPAVSFRAFEEFTKDLHDVLGALKILRMTLEKELKMDAEHSRRRQGALDQLPRVEHPAQANYSINGVARSVGKTIAHVEYGSRHAIPNVHQSELVIVHFMDGSIMSLDTGCNVRNVMPDGDAQDFHVSFHVHWVPPKN
jgi:hypothetical protein